MVWCLYYIILLKSLQISNLISINPTGFIISYLNQYNILYTTKLKRINGYKLFSIIVIITTLDTGNSYTHQWTIYIHI